jgi:hypothetical protein
MMGDSRADSAGQVVATVQIGDIDTQVSQLQADPPSNYLPQPCGVSGVGGRRVKSRLAGLGREDE